MNQPPPADIQDILERAGRGDAGAWREVVARYGPRVFGLLKSNCNDPDLAEEITQSTFCTVAGKLAGYAEQGRFESWLFRIAMNRLRDEMRRRRRQAVSIEGETLARMAGASREHSPGEAEAERERIDALHRAMAELPDADREILRLRHEGGLSFKEIAEVLEQPLGTVLARQHRALKKLAVLLSAEIDPAESESSSGETQ